VDETHLGELDKLGDEGVVDRVVHVDSLSGRIVRKMQSARGGEANEGMCATGDGDEGRTGEHGGVTGGI
jgi:hypothetical protein